MKKIKEKNRISYLDIYRGIAILLIIFGHTFWTQSISNIVFSFHLALFFFITGFLIEKSIERHNSISYIKAKTKSILVPYVIALLFSLAFAIFYDITNSFMAPHERFEGLKEVLIYNSSTVLESNYYSVYFWFLPVFFLFSIALFLIIKYLKKFLPVIFFVLLFLSIVISYYSKIGHINTTSVYWAVDKLPIVLNLGIIGYYLNKKQEFIKKNKKVIFISSLSIILLTARLFIFDVRKLIYPTVFGYYFYALMGFLMVYTLSLFIDKFKGDPIRNFLIFCGKNSLGIYLTHAFVFYWLHSAMGAPKGRHLIYNVSAIIMTLGVFVILKYIDYYLDIISKKKK